MRARFIKDSSVVLKEHNPASARKNLLGARKLKELNAATNVDRYRFNEF